MSKQSYQANRAAGRCGACGSEPQRPGACLCRVCARKRALMRAEQRDARRAQGLCPDCGLRPVVTIGNLESLCKRCAAVHIRSDLKHGRRRSNPLAVA